MNYQGANNQILGAYDASGDFFALDSMDTTITRDGSGNPLTVVATNGRDKWTQTYTYTNGFATKVSAWVKS